MPRGNEHSPLRQAGAGPSIPPHGQLSEEQNSCVCVHARMRVLSCGVSPRGVIHQEPSPHRQVNSNVGAAP